MKPRIIRQRLGSNYAIVASASDTKYRRYKKHNETRVESEQQRIKRICKEWLGA